MNHLNIIKKILTTSSFDALLISSVPNIIYLTSFSYFSKDERDGYVLVTRNNNYIITSPLYADAVRQHVKDFTLLQITRGHTLEQVVKTVVEKENIQTLGIEANNLTVSEYQKFAKIIPHITPADLSKLRTIKINHEIERIEKACQIGDKAFLYILNHIKPGITEKALATELELFIRKQQADIAFRSIVAFSENASIPHHLSQERKLKPDDVILFDFGVKYENYCSDMSRTVFFGRASEEAKRVYETVLTAQEKTITFLRPSDPPKCGEESQKKKIINASVVDKIARDYIISQGFPSIPHSLGHGIGLEVHESPHLSPFSKDILQPGMVFSIEPGIYLPDKFGIRIEDLFVLEEDGVRQVTNAPKDLREIIP